MNNIIKQITRSETKESRIKNELRDMAQSSDQYGELFSMMADLMDFTESGRPVGDWKAAESALRNFKRNY